MMQNIKGHLVLILAPTGSGKGMLIAHAQKLFPQIVTTVSCTTREKRPAEIEGVDYYYISREAFNAKVENGDFIEWAEFSGNLYGTLKSELVERLEKGQIVICEIELQGVLQLMDIIPKENRTLVYIDAGDWETMKARAQARAPISEEHLVLRYERYLHEKAAQEYADKVIINKDGEIEDAKNQMVAIIESIVANVTSHI
jgi:guanylate kinase